MWRRLPQIGQLIKFVVLVSASNLRITTHMQHDQMVIDFGFLTNTGTIKEMIKKRAK